MGRKLGLRAQLRVIIFGTDTRAGKLFDVVLIVMILLSIMVIMLESVQLIQDNYGVSLGYVEIFFTGLFTIEYVARLLTIRRPLHYALSFYGLVDLLSILPTYIALFVPGTQNLLIVRVLRVLRIFRVFKLRRFLSEGQVLTAALRQSVPKISVFLVTVLTVVVVMGGLMYVIEGRENGFTSIPKSVYWAIVTLTTVGFGDIYPKTPVGQMFASLLMIMGYGIIAVPTGIVTAELTQMNKDKSGMTEAYNEVCPACGEEIHLSGSSYCRICGEKFHDS